MFPELERILFVLIIIGSKMELFLMRRIICQWTEKIKDTILYGWGMQIFPKLPKENQNSLIMSTVCLFKKIEATKHFIIVQMFHDPHFNYMPFQAWNTTY